MKAVKKFLSDLAFAYLICLVIPALIACAVTAASLTAAYLIAPHDFQDNYPPAVKEYLSRVSK